MMNQQKDVRNKLAKGLLDLIILRSLEKHPMHGYELMTSIRSSFGVNFGASTIYPILGKMEKRKCIKSEWKTDSERPRKIYKLTEAGKTTLEYTSESLSLVRSMMQGRIHQSTDTIKQGPTQEKLREAYLRS